MSMDDHVGTRYCSDPSEFKGRGHYSDPAELKEALRECVEVLESSVLAIDDWLNTYAPEFCNKDRVKQARERIYAQGTVSYIADTQLKNRNAIKRANELLFDNRKRG